MRLRLFFALGLTAPDGRPPTEQPRFDVVKCAAEISEGAVHVEAYPQGHVVLGRMSSRAYKHSRWRIGLCASGHGRGRGSFERPGEGQRRFS
jgi:hypothetical protein